MSKALWLKQSAQKPQKTVETPTTYLPLSLPLSLERVRGPK